MSFVSAVKDKFSNLKQSVADLFAAAKNGDKDSRVKLIRYFVTLGIAVITVVLSAVLLTWGLSGSELSGVNYLDATLTLSEDVRKEYLTGEEISADGITLSYGEAEFEEFKISADLNSAGIKRVEVYHEDGNDYYRAYFNVTVFKVRHFSLEDYTLVSDETGVKCEYEKIKLDLNAAPTEFKVENTSAPKIITLDSSQYTKTVTQNADDENLYNLKFTIGSVSAEYCCVDIGDGKPFMLSSANRILKFDNVDGGNQTLTLYVTKMNGENGTNNASGFYVYTDADGKKHNFNFYYELDGWTSKFLSAGHNPSGGIYDTQWGGTEGDPYKEGMAVAVLGSNFRANMNSWHKAVLGG